jgi:hypothetical protein
MGNVKRLGFIGFVYLAAVACAARDDGPTPVVASVSPDVICTAQGDVTITVMGSGFSPAVVDGLTDEPAVAMPRVYLVGPGGAETEIPPANVSLPDRSGTALEVIAPMGLVAPVAPGDPEVVYGIRVVNPTGNAGTLDAALAIVPPPSLTAVAPTSGAQGTVVTVTLTGTGFRDGMTVTLDANPPVAGTNVTVTAPTNATADFDLTGVAPGTYDITVTNPDSCSATLPGAFTVYEPDFFALTGIDPPFGCTCSDTTVTISSAGGFVSTPRVEMRPNGQNMPVIAFERVAFVDADTLTAVVPAGAAIGAYDVTVLNPPSDGGIGTLVNGFRVVSMPIPTIEAIVPSRGDPGADTPVSIFGENFRDPVTIELIDALGIVAATVTPVTPASATRIDTTFPTNGMSEGAYLVRVTNVDENTYSTFSNFLVAATGPSGNLHTFAATSPLSTGRRMLAGASARDDLGNRYVYAIGGDTGAGGTVLDTVEVSQLSKFGDLSAWREIPNRLGTARVGAAAAAVPVFDPAGSPFIPARTYLYVTGGRDGAGAILGSVERSVVLSSKDAPHIASIGANAAPGTLEAGAWYYKVSAVLAAGDPDNPGGETLPSDEEILTIGGATTSIEITWDPVTVNGMAAAAYRVYRTDAVNGASQTEHRIAEVTDTSFVDSGEAAGTLPPLPEGATGVWTVETGALGTARWGHQAAVVPDTTGARTLTVVGGKSDAAAGYLASIEYAAIDGTDGTIGAFGTAGAAALGTARAFFSLAVETPENVSGFTGGARLFALGGVAAGATTSAFEIADGTDGGGNDAWSPYAGAGSLQARAGVMAVITSEKLFALGGALMATDAAFSNIDMNGRDVAFQADGDIDSPIQSTAEALLAPRALGVALTGAGFIYFVGGTSTGTDAVATTERTF